jgi:uncharacterized protein (TIGR00255 family)
MTGFARVRRTLPQGDIVVSLRAVNHRALDPQFHLPGDLDPFESAMRKTITGKLTRGHVDVRVHFARSTASGAALLNRAALGAWIAAFRLAATEFQIKGEPDLNTALRVPGMMNDPGPEDLGPEFEAGLLGALEEALEILNREREKEGADTVAVLHIHRERIARAALQMEAVRADVSTQLQLRMQEKLSDVFRLANADPARLAQEAAILADRSEISEELARLKIHCERLKELLEQGGETGKRLEFLAQEMQRETNTMLSKSTGAGEPGRKLSAMALEVKAEIEKIREQSLNLE